MTTKEKKLNPLRPGYFWHPFELSFCGFSNSGKTTLITNIIKELASTYQVGYLKHDIHQFNMDSEGKDTHQASSAGAHKVVISDSNHFAQITQGGADLLTEKLSFQKSDILLIEGYKSGPVDKIVVLDKNLDILSKVESGELERVVAFVGEHDRPLGLPEDIPYFQRDEVSEIKDFVLSHLQSKANEIPLYGLVLTGGKSTRMKKDKALLEYHGKSQAEFVYSRLSMFCEKTFVSSRAGQWNHEGIGRLPQIFDKLVGMGPMGGILSAQQDHPQAAWLVIACDLPFLDDKTIQDLIANRDPFKIATAFRSQNQNGLPEPLCAIYEPRSRQALFQFLSLGYQCPRKVLLNAPTKLLDLQTSEALDNANYDYEFQKFKEKLSDQERGDFHGDI